ncbi:hypothetical protein [Hymenobacter latericus]|nr:hypothetical protein [Hymenobacter sp. YIM 151858-1]UYZ58574.1 hypothetical protein OIS50_16120 [Hymenobacter sp. YIM 151858-1]
MKPELMPRERAIAQAEMRPFSVAVVRPALQIKIKLALGVGDYAKKK